MSSVPNSSDPVLAAVDLRHGPQATALLTEVLDRCRTLGSAGVVVFDLDSTLLDNKPRQALIMAEYGQAHGIPSLSDNRPEHWDGWDFRKAMRNAGLPAAEIERHVEPYREQWRAQFFTSEYCRIDEGIPGAAAFTRAVQATQARVIYVTGRHEGMRSGSVESLARLKFPVPDGDATQLWMKPQLDEDDDAFKARVHAALPEQGQVLAVFDNEPAHVNDYRRSFGDANVVHLATDHSMRPIFVDPGIPSIADFVGYRPDAASRDR